MNTIHNMYWGMAIKEQVAEAEARAYLAVINERNTHRNQNRFKELVDQLAEIDPDFDSWYEDDNNIPQYISWGHCQHVLRTLEDRIAFIKASLSPDSQSV